MDNQKEPKDKYINYGGWICPKCGYVWAWWVAGCSNCNQPKVFTAPTTTVSQGYFTIK